MAFDYSRHSRWRRKSASYFGQEPKDLELKTVRQVIELLLKMSKVNPTLAKSKLFQMAQHGTKPWRQAANRALEALEQ